MRALGEADPRPCDGARDAARPVMVIDSPFANLGNVSRALEAAGGKVSISGVPEEIALGRTIVLPGGGSFAAAARWLRSSGIGDALSAARERGAWVLGICLGHQLLFERSEEGGGERGLGFLGGVVRRFETTLPVPQIGWNRVEFEGDALFDGISSGTAFYFVHSYYAFGTSPDSEIASARYAGRFNAAVRSGTVAGVQFHPERSSEAGLKVLANFVRMSHTEEVANV
jgi:imidazole glycerol-phosphate synthase subunit HisH